MQNVPPGATCGRPALVVDAGGLVAVAAVDEQEAPAAWPSAGATVGRVADHRDHRALEAGVVDRPAEARQRVHLPDRGVDEVGLVPLPARLVLLRAAVVVDGEQHPARVAGRRRRGTPTTCRSSVPTSSSGPSHGRPTRPRRTGPGPRRAA